MKCQWFHQSVLPKRINWVNFKQICCPLSLQKGCFTRGTSSFHKKPEMCKQICPLKRGGFKFSKLVQACHSGAFFNHVVPTIPREVSSNLMLSQASSSDPVPSHLAVQNLWEDENDIYFGSYGHYAIHEEMLKVRARFTSCCHFS